ncbi:Uncharacterized protein BN1183_CU_00270 [Pantoea ananatis]|jgi:hypothetical protein|nr:hypothetical protein PANA5342_pPANA10249 [Pantoea ananatis LMG 5342]CRH37355.1 Uncharacterized protein BN1183_CU_00270 [Pantoea ananatis]
MNDLWLKNDRKKMHPLINHAGLSFPALPGRRRDRAFPLVPDSE